MCHLRMWRKCLRVWIYELGVMRTDGLEKRLSDAIGRYMIDDYKAQWKFSGDKHKSLQVYTERTFHLRYPLVML